jgi:uncharacterized paraquat-inducible protein A
MGMPSKALSLLSGMADKIEELVRTPVYEARVRSCLMCREAFESAWAGERICARCKSRHRWRTGANGFSR